MQSIRFLSATCKASFRERRTLCYHTPEALPPAEAPEAGPSAEETKQAKHRKVEHQLSEVLRDPRLPPGSRDEVQHRLAAQHATQASELAGLDGGEREELRAEGARLQGSLLELKRQVEERQALAESVEAEAVAELVFPVDGLDPELAARARDLFAARLAERHGLDLSLGVAAGEARDVLAEVTASGSDAVPSHEQILTGTREFRQLQDENLPEERSGFSAVLLELLRGLFEAAVDPAARSPEQITAPDDEPERSERPAAEEGRPTATSFEEEPALPASDAPCGPVALAEALRRMGISTSVEELDAQRTDRPSLKRGFLGMFDRRAENITWPKELVRLARQNGVSCARFSVGSPEDLAALGQELSRQGYTVIAREQNGDRFLDQHYVVLSDGGEVFNRLYETPRVRELYVLKGGVGQEEEIAAFSRKISASTSYSVG